MTASRRTDAFPCASRWKLALMGFLTLWWPLVFVWLIQKSEYPVAFRRVLTGWAIVWCLCAVIFLIVRGY
jgi:hypothetical protein